MTWQCPHCGERIDAAFDACWKCGAERALTSTEMAEQADNEAFDAAAEAETAQELQATIAQLDETVERQAATAYIIDSHVRRQLQVAQGLTRLREAYRLFRARQDRGVHAARPMLDRNWTRFLLTLGALLGWFAAMLLYIDRLARLLSAEAIVGVLGGLTILTIGFGRRAVRAELAEAAAAIQRHAA